MCGRQQSWGIARGSLVFLYHQNGFREPLTGQQYTTDTHGSDITVLQAFEDGWKGLWCSWPAAVGLRRFCLHYFRPLRLYA